MPGRYANHIHLPVMLKQPFTPLDIRNQFDLGECLGMQADKAVQQLLTFFAQFPDNAQTAPSEIQCCQQVVQSLLLLDVAEQTNDRARTWRIVVLKREMIDINPVGYVLRLGSRAKCLNLGLDFAAHTEHFSGMA